MKFHLNSSFCPSSCISFVPDWRHPGEIRVWGMALKGKLMIVAQSIPMLGALRWLLVISVASILVSQYTHIYTYIHIHYTQYISNFHFCILHKLGWDSMHEYWWCVFDWFVASSSCGTLQLEDLPGTFAETCLQKFSLRGPVISAFLETSSFLAFLGFFDWSLAGLQHNFCCSTSTISLNTTCPPTSAPLLSFG